MSNVFLIGLLVIISGLSIAVIYLTISFCLLSSRRISLRVEYYHDGRHQSPGPLPDGRGRPTCERIQEEEIVDSLTRKDDSGREALEAARRQEKEQRLIRKMAEGYHKPEWWQTWSPERDAYRCPFEVREAVQNLMNKTWSNVRTRDRQDKLQYFEVLQVLHNENQKLWVQYKEEQKRLSMDKCMPFDSIDAKTEPLHDPCLGPLDDSLNEFLLFHGTTPSSADMICANNFNIDFAGRNAGKLYGPGIYFAERSSKSDEYASDDTKGLYKGMYAMLLCRVTCGRMLITDDVKPDVDQLVKKVTGRNRSHHSVLGDREKAKGTYREFILFESQQAYPEYIIIYSRVDQIKPVNATIRSPPTKTKSTATTCDTGAHWFCTRCGEKNRNQERTVRCRKCGTTFDAATFAPATSKPMSTAKSTKSKTSPLSAREGTRESKHPSKAKKKAKKKKTQSSISEPPPSAAVAQLPGPASLDSAHLVGIEEEDGSRPLCRYGDKCYNKDPQHLARFAHPWDWASYDPPD